MNYPDLVLDVAMTPKAALAKVESSINRRGHRAFGIVKTENEFVGVVGADAFEIWEHRQRAVHAVARVQAHGGGTRIELRFAVPPPTRAFIAIFFALYGVVSLGIGLRPPDPSLSIWEVLTAAGGAALLVAGFAYAARRQRDDLRAFVARLFEVGRR